MKEFKSNDRIEKPRIKRKTKNIEDYTPNQVIERIEIAITAEKPSKAKIIKYLTSLQAKNSLSNFEFFDVIGMMSELNYEFFMVSIYPEMRVKFSKIYGDEGMRVMDKYIIERYCLDRVHKEQIIYELNGKITQFAAKFTGKVRGTIYITNKRIIAQGKFNTNIRNLSFWAGTVLDLPHLTGRHDFLTQSITKYGYQFPTDYIHRLRMSNRELSYFSGKNRIKIIPSDIEELLRTYDVIGGIQKMEERGDYENLEWLRHHYYELGWSIQDIANYQGVSMITVKKWVDKLRSTPIDTKDQKQEISQGKEGKSTCIHCGQVNIDDFKFCISCGKPL